MMTLDALRRRVADDPFDDSLLHQLADAFSAAGRPDRAESILEHLADYRRDNIPNPSKRREFLKKLPH
jgi:thioredoxin-like negative regulator of GroEL